MKMSKKLYDDLFHDCQVMFHARKLENQNKPSNQEMWALFNHVMFDRMNDDSHPAYAKGHVRVLPFWSRDGESRAEQGNDHWLNRFYIEEDLNDSHIETALKRIAKSIT